MQKYHTKSIIDELENIVVNFHLPVKIYNQNAWKEYEIDKTHKLYDRMATLFKMFL